MQPGHRSIQYKRISGKDLPPARVFRSLNMSEMGIQGPIFLFLMPGFRWHTFMERLMKVEPWDMSVNVHTCLPGNRHYV